MTTAYPKKGYKIVQRVLDSFNAHPFEDIVMDSDATRNKHRSKIWSGEMQTFCPHCQKEIRPVRFCTFEKTLYLFYICWDCGFRTNIKIRIHKNASSNSTTDEDPCNVWRDIYEGKIKEELQKAGIRFTISEDDESKKE
jgi:hypothetical protein